MSNAEQAADPSMEDILASIRKIIAEEPGGSPAGKSTIKPSSDAVIADTQSAVQAVDQLVAASEADKPTEEPTLSPFDALVAASEPGADPTPSPVPVHAQEDQHPAASSENVETELNLDTEEASAPLVTPSAPLVTPIVMPETILDPKAMLPADNVDLNLASPAVAAAVDDSGTVSSSTTEHSVTEPLADHSPEDTAPVAAIDPVTTAASAFEAPKPALAKTTLLALGEQPVSNELTPDIEKPTLTGLFAAASNKADNTLPDPDSQAPADDPAEPQLHVSNEPDADIEKDVLLESDNPELINSAGEPASDAKPLIASAPDTAIVTETDAPADITATDDELTAPTSVTASLSPSATPSAVTTVKTMMNGTSAARADQASSLDPATVEKSLHPKAGAVDDGSQEEAAVTDSQTTDSEATAAVNPLNGTTSDAAGEVKPTVVSSPAVMVLKPLPVAAPLAGKASTASTSSSAANAEIPAPSDDTSSRTTPISAEADVFAKRAPVAPAANVSPGVSTEEKAPAANQASLPGTDLAAMPVTGQTLVPGDVRTMEDTVTELLRPMLRTWLDANMPRIVEKALRVELASAIEPDKTDDAT